MHRITLIPGEGIGPEVSRAMQQVVEASGVNVQWDIQEVGAVPEKEEGTPCRIGFWNPSARTR